MATVDSKSSFDSLRYSWTFPGCPIKVAIELAVVERLEQETAASPGTRHGLLLGLRRSGVTEITGLLPVAGSTPAEVIQAAAAAGDSAAGCYCVRDGDDLRLSSDERAAAESLATRPGFVVMLILRRQSAPAAATFFFSDAIGIGLDYAFLEFPLNATELAQAERQRQAPPSPPAPAAPLAPHYAPTISAGWVVAGLALVLIAATGYRYRSLIAGMLESARRLAPPAAQPETSGSTPSLSLRAERRGEDLNVTWDTRSPMIRDAQRGTLTFIEGAGRRVIELDHDRLRFGSVLYTTGSEQLDVEMAVIIPGRDPVRQSLMVLLRQPPAQATAAPARPSRSTEPPATVHRLVLRPFSPPPSEPAVRTPLALADAPPAAALPATTTAPVPLPAPALPAAPTAAPVPVLTAGSSARPVVIAPIPIRQSQPTVPPEVKPFLRRSTTVEIRVNVDATGKVTHAEALNPGKVHALLLQSALTAAERWRFRPAEREGRPVAGEASIVFRFNPAEP